MNTVIWKLSIKTASDDLLLDLSSLWRGHQSEHKELKARQRRGPSQHSQLSITCDNEREQWHKFSKG